MRIVCACGNSLGESAAGYVVVRHDRREIVMLAAGLVAVRCERCGRINRFNADAEPKEGQLAASGTGNIQT